MILVVGQNSVWQNTYVLPALHTGKVNRVARTFTSAAGKGTNVTRCLQLLDREVLLLAYAGDTTGLLFAEACKKENLPAKTTKIASATRMCTTLIHDGAVVTEIVEPPPHTQEDERDEFWRFFLEQLPATDCLVIAGTAVAGEPVGLYRNMVQEAHRLEIPVLLDSYREHGRSALESSPEIVKINREELAELSGLATNSRNERKAASKKLRQIFGVKWIIVTAGAEGAEACCQEDYLSVASPKVNLVNSIGSGDAFTAGVVSALAEKNYALKRATLVQALELGIVMGTANCLSIKPGYVKREDLVSIRNLIVNNNPNS